MIAPTGIIFSNKTTCATSYGNEGFYTECLLDTIPALKCSIYFGFWQYITSPASKKESHDFEPIVAPDLIDAYMWDFERFHEELRCIDHFKGILELKSHKESISNN